MSQYFTCPNCGADVPIKAKACPECGSDQETGWSEAAQYTHLLPYRGDSGLETSRAKLCQKSAMAAIAVLLLVAFLAAQGLPWSFYGIPLVAFVGGVIYWMVRKYAWTQSGMEHQLYQQLLKRTRGDRKLTARLIEYEQQRHPNANRLQLIQNAIYHWDRDCR